MSLSALLLGGEKASKASTTSIDHDLDNLFKSSVGASASLPLKLSKAKSSTTSAPQDDTHVAVPRTKRKNGERSASEPSRIKKRARTTDDTPDARSNTTGSQATTKSSQREKSSKPVITEAPAEDDEERSHPVSSTKSPRVAVLALPGRPYLSRTEAEGSSAEENSDGDPSELVHETISKGTSGSLSRKAKFVPQGETPEQRDSRTIFVGNLAADIVKNRPSQKQFKRHILSLIPTAKIESIRYRSIAFEKPTSKLDDAEKPPKSDAAHGRERAASWRQSRDDTALKADEKKFLTPAEKKRVAFITRALHPTADTVHAYVVFAHPPDGGSAEVMDPYEAAKLAVERCNGITFLERTIRVDHVVSKGAPTGDTDARRTVFVGSLDFTSKEEDLRVFFEGIVSAERGPPPSGAWVARVRIVRDKETQLGKGFAYVQFIDRNCVDEIIAMDAAKLKFAKRKIRVQRCKTVPGGPPVPTAPKRAPAPVLTHATRRPATPITVPRGDPTLGARLASLSKPERKQAKASDADRIARRLAKKAAKLGAAQVPGPDKLHARARPTARKGSGVAKREVKKRVRSDGHLAKKNIKK